MTRATHLVLVQATDAQLKWYLFLQMWPSHLGLPLILITIFCSKKIQRHPVFISFIISWIIIGIMSALLLYAGQATGPEPDLTLCLVQASITYGCPPMAAFTAFMLVLQVLLVVQSSVNGTITIQSQKSRIWRLWLMVATPYIVFIIFVVVTAILGSKNPATVSRTRRYFYCSVEAKTFTDAFAIITAGVLIITVILEIWIVVALYKRWKTFRTRGNGSDLQSHRPIDLNLCFRVLAFGLYISLVIGLNLLSLTSPTSPVPDLLLGTAGSAVFFIFGTQSDFLEAWCFWRRFKKDRISPDQSEWKTHNRSEGEFGNRSEGEVNLLRKQIRC